MHARVGHLLCGRDARTDVPHAAFCMRRLNWPLAASEPEAYMALIEPLKLESTP